MCAPSLISNARAFKVQSESSEVVWVWAGSGWKWADAHPHPRDPQTAKMASPCLLSWTKKKAANLWGLPP